LEDLALDDDCCFLEHRFVEATLAQIYKDLGEFRGGLLFISRGLGVKWLFICRGFYHFGRCIAA
jgi:Na+/alanine symporter